MSNQSRTPLEDAEIRGKRECAKLLKDYFPSRDDKLKIQLECKNFIDKLLEFKGRFNQGNVDIFYTALKEEVDADFKKLNVNGQLSTGRVGLLHRKNQSYIHQFIVMTSVEIKIFSRIIENHY